MKTESVNNDGIQNGLLIKLGLKGFNFFIAKLFVLRLDGTGRKMKISTFITYMIFEHTDMQQKKIKKNRSTCIKPFKAVLK